MRWIFVLGMATAASGCMREPTVVPPQPIEVIISQPVKEKIEDWDTYTGTVEAKESVPIRANPTVRGQIMRILFSEGDEIAENKLLFVIDDAPFQANLLQSKGQLATWQAKLTAAEAKIAIYKPLADKGTVSKEELVQAIGAKGEALGGIDTAKGKIMEAENNIRYSNIRAPIAGKIGEPQLKVGAIVNSGVTDGVLTTIVSVDPQYVYFYISERALLDFQKNMLPHLAKDQKTGKLIVPVKMATAIDTDFPHKGFVDFADIKIDKNTGTYKVRAVLPNPIVDGRRLLTPGLFARVRVGVSEPYSPILIADRAILSDQSLKYVLVVNKAKNNVVERVDIVPSERLQPNGLRAIESGLKGDEWIIVEGVNRARPGATVAPKDPIPMPRRPGTK